MEKLTRSFRSTHPPDHEPDTFMKKSAIIATTLAVVLVTGLLIFVSLPRLITSYGPTLLEKAGIAEGELRLDTLSPNRMTFSATIGNADTQSLSLPRVELFYSPLEIVQGKIRSLVVTGGTVNLQLDNGRLYLDHHKASPDVQAEPPSRTGLPLLPVIVESIRLSNCMISIQKEGGKRLYSSLSARMDLQTSSRENSRYRLDRITASVNTATPAKSTFHATADIQDGAVQLDATATLDDLAFISAMTGGVPPGISGGATLTTSLKLDETLSYFSDLDALLTFRNLSISDDVYLIRSTSGNGAHLHLTGNSHQLEYTISGIEAQSGDHSVSHHANGTIDLENRQLLGNSTFSTDLLPEQITLTYNGGTDEHSTSLDFSLQSPPQRYTAGKEHITIDSSMLQGRVIHKDGETAATGSYHLNRIALDTTAVSIPEIKGSFSYSPDTESSHGNFSLKTTIPRLLFQDEDFAGATLNLDIPAATQRLQVGGALMGHQENPIKIVFSGSYDTTNGGQLTYAIEESSVDTDSLPSFVSIPPSLDFSADIWASGTFTFQNGTPSGKLKLNASNGNVTDEDKSLTISGIETELHFNNLPGLATPPAQMLSIDSLEMGTIHVGNGKVFFRIEDDTSLFIEKSRFDWCGGKVEIGSTWIRHGSKDFSTTLYCDRLQFADLLGQFGISDTDGDGSLNGKLPVEYSAGSFVFDDGFLFSTPGNSGIVHFNNTDMLKQSLPDMSQAAYLDYSIQALENFAYNWTKLTFTSEGDDLLISMQIDGKPAAPLPFGYRKGHLVKHDTGKGIQHPLRLDVNFHLPFAEMFRYGQNIQKIMENM